ncbi:MAG: PDZ domain-containing protein [Xanthomonadales bacterium]|nr:PDZ domain-containing protein [Xanthomonadales bacterium]
MKLVTSITVLALSFFVQTAFSQQTLLLKQPSVSAQNLAYVYAGDIWVANRDGSSPRRLTSSPAEENNPFFSPDGKLIAFMANYEDNNDVYFIPVSGGQPQRLTWHPGSDIPTGWTPDGTAVTMVSARETDHGRSGQLFHASINGGLPVKQMEARVYRGSYDADGTNFAYIAYGSGYNGLFGGSSGWKGYRGGTTPAVKIMDIKAQTVTTVPGADVTNFNPVWLGGQLYFISDRENEIFNIYRYDPANQAITKISNEPVWDVRAFSGHGTTLVYESGGQLKSLDTGSARVSDIPVFINPDLPQLRTQWKDASGAIQHVDISPSGKRVIITARGVVFTVPVEDGAVRNISQDGTTREYSAIWSPKGDQVAYITESNDGQSLVLKDQTGRGNHTQYELGPHFYQLLAWGGGDKPRIVYEDNHLSLFSIDPASGTISEISTGVRREQVDVSVSPDGKWLAYTLEQSNYNRDLALFNFETGSNTVVTDGSADVASPAFSKDGKYLYFAASTNSGPIQVGLNMTSQERPYRAGLYALVLAADGKSPVLAGVGDENEDDETDSEKEKEQSKNEEDKDADKIPETRIDLQNLSARFVALPVAENNYGNLSVDKDGNLFYIQETQPGISVDPPGTEDGAANTLVRFDFKEKEATTLLTGLTEFRLSANGSHLIINKSDGSLAIAETGDELEPEKLSLDGLKIQINPLEEWTQIFNEAWRMEKEYFYAKNMHGLDWQAVYDRYRPLVNHVGRREDLSALMVEMIAEMQAGHNRTGGGDVHKENGTNTGLLGANFVIDQGRYQIAKVYNGEHWNPFIKAPLATPGNEVGPGEYILAINGRELSSLDNIFNVLQGTSGKQVNLRVGPRANGRDAREIVVEPVDSERMMRLWSWIENNRRAIDKATNGRVGYVYLPNTAGAGYTFFNRMFFAQIDKEAMIIDERSNAGGQAANYITDVLSRRHLSGWKDRDGLIFNTPAGAIHGPKVMLIDQDAGSGGDYLPYSFRELGIGKLMGTRTWGGLIGISTNPDLVDGGYLTVPYFRFFDTDGQWSVENEGVAPDIEVELDPIASNQDRDSQLEKAISEVLSQLQGFENPVSKQAPPLPTEPGK